jgi:hypothetical protein
MIMITRSVFKEGGVEVDVGVDVDVGVEVKVEVEKGVGDVVEPVEVLLHT